MLSEGAEKTLLMHNGVDIEELTRLGEATGSEARASYLLCIAACNSKKAVDVYLCLVLVGDGPPAPRTRGVVSTRSHFEGASRSEPFGTVRPLPAAVLDAHRWTAPGGR